MLYRIALLALIGLIEGTPVYGQESSLGHAVFEAAQPAATGPTSTAVDGSISLNAAEVAAPSQTTAASPTPPERWFLMKELQGTWPGFLLDGNRMQISGWTDASFTASSDERSNLPMGFNYRADKSLIQQNWLRIEQSVVTSGTTEPTFGFRADTILPGADYRFTLPRGIANGQLTDDNGNPRLYGVDPIQFYGEAYVPTIGRGLDIKVGRFFAQYGVEDIDAPSSALFSHTYTFIYDPFTHAGVLATLKLTDSLSVQAGLVLGSDVFIDPADELTFIGSVKWTTADNRDAIELSVIVGPGRYNQSRDFNNPEIFDLVYTHKFNPRLDYSFESLVGFETNVTGIGTANWFGILDYLTYDFTPRLSGTTRFEILTTPRGSARDLKAYTRL